MRSPVILSPPAGYGADSTSNDSSQFRHPTCMQSPKSRMGGFCVESVRFGNGTDAGGGRGKKRAREEPPGDTAERKQWRMIKNRESAARSRVRNKVIFELLFQWKQTIDGLWGRGRPPLDLIIFIMEYLKVIRICQFYFI